MTRIDLAKEKYQKLSQKEFSVDPKDPEFMTQLQYLIFGEVFYIGDLSDTKRELVTCSVLCVLQALPQLKAHLNAALNIGVPSLELREALYQCAPFIGYPRTLNAIAVLNDVFEERGIKVPLANQIDFDDALRYEKGLEIQMPLYGTEIQERYSYLPKQMAKALQRFLTEWCFGDFYARKALDIQTRELLVLCILTALNATT